MSPETHWQRYHQAIERKNDAQATRHIVTIIGKTPSDPKWNTVAWKFAQERAKRGDETRAIAVFNSDGVSHLPQSKFSPQEKANILREYGALLTKRGDDLTARQIYEQLLELQRTYKSDNIITGVAQQMLGDIATRNGRAADAATHFDAAIKLYGNNPAFIGSVADNYGALLQAQGKTAEAEKYFLQAKASWLKGFGPHNAYSVYGTTLLAEFYVKTERPQLAEANLREALTMFRTLPATDERETERTRLVDLYTRFLTQQKREKKLPKMLQNSSREKIGSALFQGNPHSSRLGANYNWDVCDLRLRLMINTRVRLSIATSALCVLICAPSASSENADESPKSRTTRSLDVNVAPANERCHVSTVDSPKPKPKLVGAVSSGESGQQSAYATATSSDANQRFKKRDKVRRPRSTWAYLGAPGNVCGPEKLRWKIPNF